MNSHEDLYMHFHPDEHRYVDRAREWVERAGQQHTLTQTYFLDPRQQMILQSLVNREPDVIVRLDGGYSEAERKRAIIAPDYRDLSVEHFGIGVLSIESQDQRYTSLEHGDFLGALIGLGMKRGHIGDIHPSAHFCHCLVTEEMMPYILSNLNQVHRVNVMAGSISLDQLQPMSVKFEEMTVTSASMRLDGILGDVFRMSRAKSALPIKAGRCRVNWKVVENPSHALQDGDIVSTQGFGRFKVLSADGPTKKGNIRLKIGKFI